MNWAKKLLTPKDGESFTLPSHDCPRCGDRLRDDGDRLVCDQCGYPEPEDGFDEEGNPIEVDEPTCDVCGEVLDSESPTCPVCGVALCGDKECADEHIAEHHPEWDEDDEDEPPGRCDDCERDGRCDGCPGHPGGVPVDPHDPENVPFTPFHAGLEHDRFFLESDFGKTSTPLIATTGWRVARRGGKTYCPAVDGTVWCQEDGYWKKCPFRWSHLAPTEAAQEDMPFTPVKPMTELDQAYLASSFHKYSCRAAFIDAFGNRYALFRNDDGQEVWPAKDGSLWVLTNDLQWVKLTAYWRDDCVSKHSNPFDS